MSMMPPPQAATSYAYNSLPYPHQQQASGSPNFQQHNSNGIGMAVPPGIQSTATRAGAHSAAGGAPPPLTPSAASGPPSSSAASTAAAMGALFPPGAAILRLMQLFDAMVGKGTTNEFDMKGTDYWQRLVQEFFVLDGYFRQVFWNTQAGEQRAFELPVPVLARYLQTIHLTGVESRHMILSQAKEYPPHALRSIPSPPETKRAINGTPNSRTTHFVQVNRAKMSLEYESGWMVVQSGLLRAALTPEPLGTGLSMNGSSLKFQFVDFHITEQENFVPRSRISRAITEQTIPEDIVTKIRSGNGDPFKRDEKKEKRNREDSIRGLPSLKGEDDREMDNQEGRFVIPVEKTTLPEAPVNEFGITLRAMRCLEITESVCQLRDLMDYAAQQDLGPLNALHHLAEELRSAQSGRVGVMVNGSSQSHGGYGNGPAISEESNRPGTGRSPLSTSGSGGMETLNTSPSSSGGGSGGASGAGVGVGPGVGPSEYEGLKGGDRARAGGGPSEEKRHQNGRR